MTRIPVVLSCIVLLLACSRQNPPLAVTQTTTTAVSPVADISSLANTLRDRWQLHGDGIRWQVRDAHQDQLEFSGEQVSAIVSYGADAQGRLLLERKVVWPMLRTIPNDTHANLIHSFDLTVSPQIKQAGLLLQDERPALIEYDGLLRIQSRLGADLQLTRTLAPSPTGAFIIEQHTLTNLSNQTQTLQIQPLQYQQRTDAAKGVTGSYLIKSQSDFAGDITLAPGASKSWQLSFSAAPADVAHDISAETAAMTLVQVITEFLSGFHLSDRKPGVL